MQRNLIASLAMLALAGTSAASAADLSNPPIPPTDFPAAAPITFDWTGAYLGLTAGYGFGKFPSNLGTVVAPGVVTNGLGNAGGFIGGGTVGYQMQFGQFVAGLEGELNYTGIGDSFAASNPLTGDARLTYLGMVTGRLGFTPFDRFLVYGKGGYAFGGAEVSIDGVGSDTNFHNGWTLGAGLEYAITQNLTTKIEYNYVDLQRQNFNIGGTTTSAGFQGNLLRAGLNYKF
jgi:outer membrane immunogenic protein